MTDPQFTIWTASFQSRKAAYSAFLATPFWKQISDAAKSRDKACRSCGSKHCLQAHHLSYPTNWFNTTLGHLKTLCKDCHERVHKRPKQPKIKKVRRVRRQKKQPVQRKNCPQTMHKITHQDILALGDFRGCFTRATLYALGFIRQPPFKGWQSSIIGTSIPESQFLLAMKGRSIWRD